MIIIDYPPGGLGNFVAQIITNTVENINHVSFHRNWETIDKHYDIQLVQRSKELFLSVLNTWKPKHRLAIAHGFGAIHEVKNRVNCEIISIRPVNNWLQLFLNKEMKAAADDRLRSEQQTTYDFYCRTYANIKAICDWPVVGKFVNFDDFYQGQEKFYQLVHELNPNADAEKIYEIFCVTQKPILDKLEYLKQLSITNDSTDHLNNFDRAVVDGLKASMHVSLPVVAD